MPTATVELVTADGVRLTGRRLASAEARATVVLVHGFGATSDDDRVVAVADALHDAGTDVLTYDARGHGRSGGDSTLGDLEQLDVAAAVDLVAGAGRPVVLVGASMGAIGVLRYAAAPDHGLAGVVTVSCPARWRLPRNARGIASAVLTQTPMGRWFARRQMGVRIAGRITRPAPPVELVPSMRAPLAVIHGLADPFIAPSDAEELYAAAPDPRRLDLIPGLGHAYEPESIQPVLHAVDWCLRQPPPRSK
jgi:alpha-beta hydrolase superfamily lysophospholipase